MSFILASFHYIFFIMKPINVKFCLYILIHTMKAHKEEEVLLYAH